jgi:hypothetical protein
VFGDGFEIFGYGGNQRSRDITITGSLVDHPGRMGISVAAAQRVTFDGNVLTSVRRSILDIEPPTAGHGVRNIKFTNNQVKDDDAAFYLLANGGNADAVVENVTIAHNQLDNQKVNAFINMAEISRVGTRQPSRINIRIIRNSSNVEHGAPFTNQAPIQAAATVGLVVRGNTQPIQPNQRVHAVTVYQGTRRVVVSNNTFVNALSALADNPDFKPNWNLAACNNVIGNPEQIDRACP